MIMVICIDNIMYPNKNHDLFPLGLVHIMYQMTKGIRYDWEFYIISQMYHDLHNFLMTQKSGRWITHSSLLQCWAYENILIIHPM